MDNVTIGTLFLISVTKTRRCYGFEKRIAYAIAKGEPQLVEGIGMLSLRWLRPSRVLMDWGDKAVVAPCLGRDLLIEISYHMEVM